MLKVGRPDRRKEEFQVSDFNEDLNRIMNDAEDTTEYFEPEDIEKNKWVCALAYLSILFFLPLVVCPNSRYGKYHANQALILFLVSVIGNVAFGIARKMLSVVFMGWAVSIASTIWGLLIFLFMLMGIFNVLGGRAKELPVIGKLRLIRVD